MRIFCVLLVWGLLLGTPGTAAAQGTGKYNVTFCCRSDNDLFRLLSSRSEGWNRFDRPKDALRFSGSGSGILILADGYPFDMVEADPALFDEAVKKNIRIYIEYAKELPGLWSDKQTRETQWERGVVTSKWFEPGVPRLRLLALHDCHFVPYDQTGSSLALARVAGYDTAAFDLPQWLSPRYPQAQLFPLLVKHPLGEVMVATSKLSQFITARYAPAQDWVLIWQTILQWAARQPVEMPVWIPNVHPTFGATDTMPDDVEEQAWRRGALWYAKAKLAPDPTWQRAAKEGEDAKDHLALGAEPQWVAGDGKAGMFEGFSSKITFEGRQLVRFVKRADCMSESAMALAFDGVTRNDTKNQEVATNLLDYVYFNSDLNSGPRADVKNPAYGLLGWSTGPGAGSYYGDDNARAMLATMAASALLKTNRWDEALTRCLLANLRTTGVKGFRNESVDQAALEQKGWHSFYAGDAEIYAPHYEAYLWACYLWAFKHTDNKEFLDKAKTAIKMTMEAYPHKWKWTNGIQQERARMLLPLAWLVRVEDNEQNRQWLKKMATDMLALQDESGAIREELGPEGNGAIPPPKSNETYGAAESPIIQQNGDPACDLLYTTNFAFLGLHEAAAATGEPFYADAEKKLARFLCRIQVRSLLRPELDGAWFRAFDFKRWEYWGSSSDVGWGAWCIESGWTQGWITSVFLMRHRKASLWEMTADLPIKMHIEKLQPVMFAEETPPPAPATPAAPAAPAPAAPAPAAPAPAAPAPAAPAPAAPAPVPEVPKPAEPAPAPTPAPPAPEAPK